MNKKVEVRLSPKEFAYFIVGFKVLRDKIKSVNVPTISSCLTKGNDSERLHEKVNNKIKYIKSVDLWRENVKEIPLYSKKINSSFRHSHDMKVSD